MSERRLTPLEARKQLLVAESELNRKLLGNDYRDVAGSLDHLAEPVRHAHSLVMRAISLFAFVRALGTPRRTHNGTGGGLPTRLMRLGAALWVGMKTNRS